MHEEELIQTGAILHSWQVTRSGMSVWNESMAIWSLMSIYRRVRPDIVHHFTVKPILYGTFAARATRIPHVVNSVTGLGHVFTTNHFKNQVIRPVMRRFLNWSLSGRNVRPMYQNEDDLKILSGKFQRVLDSTTMTIGSGVELDVAHAEENGSDEIQILFVGRLLVEKGIQEFVAAARACLQRSSCLSFHICGSLDDGNPSSIDSELLEEWSQYDGVNFHGHVADIGNHISEADIVVLPSYREGTPRSLMEGAASGKPLIATDVPGCREIVHHGINGLLVPPRDVDALTEAILDLAADGPTRKKYGDAGRRIAEFSYSDRDVNRRIRNVYRDYDRQQTANRDSVLDRGAFTFSLDFELAWGTRGRPREGQLGDYFDGTRYAIRRLLQLCLQYEIKCTWATVAGLLMGTGKTGNRHSYLKSKEFSDIPHGDCRSHPHWYADDIVDEILDCPIPQELGCHTATHTTVDPSPTGRRRLKQELEASDEVFAERGLSKASSFIYPRGFQSHFGLLADHGYTAYRGPEDRWFECLPSQKVRAGLRLFDAILERPPLTRNPSNCISGLWTIPSSQFYSPLMSVGRRVTIENRVAKAIKGLHQACEGKSVYHLWTHPFNLGRDPDQLLNGLERIFSHVQVLRDEGKLQVMTMKEVATTLESSIF